MIRFWKNMQHNHYQGCMDKFNMDNDSSSGVVSVFKFGYMIVCIEDDDHVEIRIPLSERIDGRTERKYFRFGKKSCQTKFDLLTSQKTNSSWNGSKFSHWMKFQHLFVQLKVNKGSNELGPRHTQYCDETIKINFFNQYFFQCVSVYWVRKCLVLIGPKAA